MIHRGRLRRSSSKYQSWAEYQYSSMGFSKLVLFPSSEIESKALATPQFDHELWQTAQSLRQRGDNIMWSKHYTDLTL
jgi:hypothetical protein